MIFAGPPSGKKAVRVMSDNDQVDSECLSETGYLVNCVPGRVVTGCDDTPCPQSVDTFRQHLDFLPCRLQVNIGDFSGIGLSASVRGWCGCREYHDVMFL